MSLAALLTLLVSTGEGQGIGADARVNLRVEQRKLSEVVQYLREQSGANIVLVVPEGGDVAISLELSDVPWRDALDIAAEAANCVVAERAAGILAVEKPARVTYDTLGEAREVTDVINLIAKVGGANIVVAPEVAGTLSLRLTDVPWRDALDVAVKTLGYVVVEEDRGILRVVDPITLQAQMTTQSYQLRYLRPKGRFRPQIKSEFLVPAQVQAIVRGESEIAKDFTVIAALSKALSPGGELDYIASNNVIIVRDTAQVHQQIKDMLNRLDVEPPQVFIDVKFVSTQNGDLLDLGFDYGDSGAQISAGMGQVPITLPFGLGGGGLADGIIVNDLGKGPFTTSVPPASGSGRFNAGATVIPDTIFGALDFTQFQFTLKMLQRDSRTEVIQAPKLVAIDGAEATIFVGETVRYAEAKSEQGQAGGLQLSLQEATGSPVDTGFQLMIVPHVIPGTNSLMMDVIPKETSLSGTGTSALAPAGFDVFTIGAAGLEGSIALPRTRSSTIVTSMLLESGQSAVIGGLTTDSEVETESRVPFISRIPVLGELFKHRTKEKQLSHLIVFITPTVVHSPADTEMILQRELGRRRGRLKEEVEEMMDPSKRAANAKAKKSSS
jgi:type IV pilus assembly protein PilQ